VKAVFGGNVVKTEKTGRLGKAIQCGSEPSKGARSSLGDLRVGPFVFCVFAGDIEG